MGSERCKGGQKGAPGVRQVGPGLLQASIQGERSSAGPDGAKIDPIEQGRQPEAGVHNTGTWPRLGSAEQQGAVLALLVAELLGVPGTQTQRLNAEIPKPYKANLQADGDNGQFPASTQGLGILEEVERCFGMLIGLCIAKDSPRVRNSLGFQ